MQIGDIKLVCQKCNKEKPIGDFPRDKNRKFGVQLICKKCMSERIRKYRTTKQYNITEEDYQLFVNKYKNQCAICGQFPKNNRRLYIDHNHITGKVRGLLCHNCNIILGMAKDDIEILQRAIYYLTENK